MARDATARQYDVDADFTKLDKKAGTISFQAKKGRLVDLDKLHESVWATRLGDGTGMTLRWLDVTVRGQVQFGVQAQLKVTGSDQFFLLGAETEGGTREEKEAYQRLKDALERGEKVLSVTGRVEGWKGNLTQFSKLLPPKPRTFLVKDFQTAKP